MYVCVTNELLYTFYVTGHLIQHKWENAMTIDKKSWGFRRKTLLQDILSIEELIAQLVTTVR